MPSAARSTAWSAVSTGSRADVLERLLDAAAVAHAVVDDRDHVSVPFVDGTPVSLGSTATATRSARANALKHASIMWWALVPAWSSRCSVSRAAEATARKNSSASSCSKPAMSPAGSRSKPSTDANGRPEMSIAHSGARLVHRHDGVAVAGDPAAVAERLVERLAEHDPGVLDRVVGAGLQVAGDLDLEVEPAVAGEQVEHVVEEADAGRAACRRPCRRARA